MEKVTHFAHELRHIAAAKMWNRLLQQLGLEFSEESQRNLIHANNLLKDNSLVVYINHTSMKDAELAISMVFSFLTNAKRIIGPAGMKHYDINRDPKNAMLFRLLKSLGITILPIAQQDDDRDYGYVEEQMRTKLRDTTKSTMELPGSVDGIAPEGTRSRDGKLLQAKRGIGFLDGYNPGLFYLPVAIAYREFSGQPSIFVGKPLCLKDMIAEETELPNEPKEKAQFLADLHMQRLAGMLPEHMRGFYGER